MHSRSNAVSSRVASGALVAGLLVLSAGLAVHTASRKAVTADEPKHIATAAYFLSEGRCCLGRDNSPSLLLNGLPLLLASHPASHPGASSLRPGANPWAAGKSFLLGETNLNATILAARLPSILLLVALGVIVFLWSRELYGRLGGLISLFLIALSPNLLAQASLVSPDIHAAFFLTLAAWAFFRFSARPSGWRWLAAGLALGLALSAKLSALVLVPVFGVLAVLEAGRRRETGSRGTPLQTRVLLRLAATAGVVVVALVVVWLAYGARTDAVSMNGKPAAVPGFADPLEGVQKVARLGARGGHSYLLGQYRYGGWWYYFPVAFAAKTPIPLMLACLASILLAPWIVGRNARREVYVWLPAVALVAAAMASRLNVGIRHLLPLYPLLHVFAGRLAGLRLGPLWARASLLAVAAGWYLLGTVAIHPHHLAYYNALAGGPKGGCRWVADSNIDWGQDLKELRRYLDGKGDPTIRLSYNGPMPPGRYGIRYQPLPSVTPHPEDPPREVPVSDPDLVVVSAYNLMGIHPSLRETYAWLRRRPPVARPGYSLFVYDITGDREAHQELARVYRAAGMERLAAVEELRWRALVAQGGERAQ